MRHLSGALVTATTLFVCSVLGQTDPIVIKGAKFFHKNSGDQFFMKGVAYQQEYVGEAAEDGANESTGYNDPLADPDGCRRDIPLLKQIDTNALRVYAVDPTKDHDECMSLLADAGIYIIADLSAPGNGSIISDDPVWDDKLYARYASVIDVMAKYDNTMGFFAGNEVANAPNNTESAPFVKAAVRDMKAYIKSQGYREIGVGYATSDDPDVREPLANFFNCGNQEDAIDFWGYNIYSWCGDSSYEASGYADRTRQFSTYSVPSFFAEYGCNTEATRPFTEVLALYGNQMSEVFSGGIVYQWFQGENDYGLVTVNNDQDVQKLPDFSSLSSQIAKVTPKSVAMNAYQPSNNPQACPTSNADFRAQSTPLPPSPNEELCSCMVDALNCVVDPSVDEDDYEDLFSTVCGLYPKACAGIEHDSGSATYGAYSMCDPAQQLSWAMNLYYLSQNKAADACDFGGAGKVQQNNLNKACQGLLQEAGSFGTNTVTSSPTVTGAGAASSGSESGSAGAVTVPNPETGLLPMAFIVTLAAVSGVAAVFL